MSDEELLTTLKAALLGTKQETIKSVIEMHDLPVNPEEAEKLLKMHKINKCPSCHTWIDENDFAASMHHVTGMCKQPKKSPS